MHYTDILIHVHVLPPFFVCVTHFIVHITCIHINTDLHVCDLNARISMYVFGNFC